MTKRYKVPIQVFDDSVALVFTTDYEKYVKKYFKEYCEGEDLNDDGWTFTDKNGQTYVIFDILSCDEGTLLHESVHAASGTLRYRGIELSDETEETYAYTIEFLFKSFQKRYQRVKDKINGDNRDTSKNNTGQVLQNVLGDIKSSIEADGKGA